MRKFHGSIAVSARMIASLGLCTLTYGCGSSGSVGPGVGKNLNAFIGTWAPTYGTTTLTCATQEMTQPVSGSDTWRAGSDSDLIQPPDPSSGGCSLRANVSGAIATALPNQTCTQSMAGTRIDLTISSYRFTVSADGQTAIEVGRGSGVVTTSGTSNTCTYREMATYSRSP